MQFRDEWKSGEELELEPLFGQRRGMSPWLGESSLEEEIAPSPTGGAKAPLSRCPPDSLYVVRDFPPTKVRVSALPMRQRAKLKEIAGEISRSQSTAAPIFQVLVTGHAEPWLGLTGSDSTQLASEWRANNVITELKRLVSPTVSSRVIWVARGRADTEPAVPEPKTKAEHRCNRRVEIRLFPRF